MSVLGLLIVSFLLAFRFAAWAWAAHKWHDTLLRRSNGSPEQTIRGSHEKLPA